MAHNTAGPHCLIHLYVPCFEGLNFLGMTIEQLDHGIGLVAPLLQSPIDLFNRPVVGVILLDRPTCSNKFCISVPTSMIDSSSQHCYS